MAGEVADRFEVGGLPLGGDAEAGFAHESGREGEGGSVGIEAGEHDLAAGCEARRRGYRAGRRRRWRRRWRGSRGGRLAPGRKRRSRRRRSARASLRSQTVGVPPARTASRASRRPSTPWPMIRVRDGETGHGVLRRGGEGEQGAAFGQRLVDGRALAIRGRRGGRRRRRTGRGPGRSSGRRGRTRARRARAPPTTRPTDS